MNVIDMGLDQAQKLLDCKSNTQQRHTQQWEEIFANNVTNRLISGTYKVLKKLSHNETSPVKKWTNAVSQRMQYRWLTDNEKIFRITNHQWNADRNQTEVSSHTSYNGCPPKMDILLRVWEKRYPNILLVQM